MSKRSNSWKDLERTAAKKLGGKRIVRGDDFSVSDLDVLHDWLAIDCKYRTDLTTCKWYAKLVKDAKKLYPKDNKIPILVLKEKGMRGELVVIHIDDFIMLCNRELGGTDDRDDRDD